MAGRASRQREGLTGRWIVPSWLMSFGVHALLVLALLVLGQRWQTAPVGFGEGAMRTVGIIIESSPESTSLEPVVSHEIETKVAVTTPAPVTIDTPQTAMPQLPAGPAANDGPAIPTVGTGALQTASVSTDPRSVIRSASGQSASAALNGGIPGTAFMGTKDNATRVVFVIDCSASMENHGAMRSAKAALVSSLQGLVEDQQFQIIFYSDKPRVLQGRGGSELFFATELNKTMARQYIAGIEPEGGTEHIPALELALKFGPEVIYFLTDADEPQLSAKQLDDLRRRNQGRTRIHAIEFGTGGALSIGVLNFLQKLAQQHGGTYRYYDVKRLEARS